MTRVLHLISDNSRRGAQVFALQLQQELHRSHGLDGALVALRDEAVDPSAAVPAALAPHGRRERRRFISRYDVVVAHGSTTLDVAAIHAPGRFVYRSIGDPRFWLDRPRRRLKTGLALARAAKVVALYDDAALALSELASVDPDDVAVIPNAVEVDPTGVRHAGVDLIGVPGGERTAIFVGSLSWEKRVHLIIEAVAKTDGMHLIVIGTGPLEREVDELGARLLGPRFHHVGPLTDVRPYYAAADVLTLASVTEGQPGAILEAAAFGVPTVSAPVGGVPDMLQRLGFGTCADPEDPVAFAAALTSAAVRQGGVSDHRSDASAAQSMADVASKWAVLLREMAAQRPDM